MRRRSWNLFIAAILVVDACFLAWWFLRSREHRYDRHIAAAAARYQLDPALVKAVIWKESRFHPSALGAAGEVGLMQIREPAAQEWCKAENVPSFNMGMLLDPAINTECGSWYLAKLLRRYTDTDNPAAYALADYNAGRTHVLRWIQGAAATNSTLFLAQVGFPTTRRYITDVLSKRPHYQSHFAPTTPRP